MADFVNSLQSSFDKLFKTSSVFHIIVIILVLIILYYVYKNNAILRQIATGSNAHIPVATSQYGQARY